MTPLRLPWFREANIEPMVVTMSAVRSGERLLQVGVDDPAHAGGIAAKVGIGGDAAMALPDSPSVARTQAALRKQGVIDAHVGLETLPGGSGAWDVVVIHGVGGLLARRTREARNTLLRECARVLRPRGRLVVIEAGPAAGFSARLGKPDPYVEAGGAVPDLEGAGFRPVRVLGERDGYRFIEGLRP
jgi:SAM-dependent methyltransferase